MLDVCLTAAYTWKGLAIVNFHLMSRHTSYIHHQLVPRERPRFSVSACELEVATFDTLLAKLLPSQRAKRWLASVLLRLMLMSTHWKREQCTMLSKHTLSSIASVTNCAGEQTEAQRIILVLANHDPYYNWAHSVLRTLPGWQYQAGWCLLISHFTAGSPLQECATSNSAARTVWLHTARRWASHCPIVIVLSCSSLWSEVTASHGKIPAWISHWHLVLV